jgi:hypothetical protein
MATGGNPSPTTPLTKPARKKAKTAMARGKGSRVSSIMELLSIW